MMMILAWLALAVGGVQVVRGMYWFLYRGDVMRGFPILLTVSLAVIAFAIFASLAGEL